MPLEGNAAGNGALSVFGYDGSGGLAVPVVAHISPAIGQWVKSPPRVEQLLVVANCISNYPCGSLASWRRISHLRLLTTVNKRERYTFPGANSAADPHIGTEDWESFADSMVEQILVRIATT